MTGLAARLRNLPSDMSTALAFFSRLPLHIPAASFDLRKASAAWPLAGVFLALIPCAVLLVGETLHFSHQLLALLVLVAGVVASGGLHEDGLADAADGMGGGRTREAKLAIMRDSRLGSYGALALILSVAIKAAALEPLVVRPVHAIVALLATAALSRSMALWHWHATLPARPDGLASLAGRPDGVSMAISSAFGIVAALIALVLFGVPALLGLAIAVAGIGAFTALCKRQIGGHTGDTIGASQQIAETLLLVGLSGVWQPVIAPVST